jgi:protein involved in polysaccharide export with SLBB domain
MRIGYPFEPGRGFQSARSLAPVGAFGSLLLLLVCAGCASKNKDMLHFLREHRHQVSATEYRVGIPDAIAISAPRILEIDGDTQRIQPDGKIHLRLLGEIKIVGMTAKEIAAKLEVLLSRYYIDPKVSVRIAGYSSKKYYIYGQALALGAKAYTGRDTLLDAVLQAGLDFRSWTSRVTVIRPSHGETPVRTIRVNVDKMIKTGRWDDNILLEPNDIVYVPPTPAAWLAQRVYEVFYPIGPVVQAYIAPAYLSDLGTVYKGDEGNRLGSYGTGFSTGGTFRP